VQHEQEVTTQLNKLINVLKIVELEDASSVQRELLLVKVRAEAAQRTHVLEVVQLFRAHVVDVVPDAVTIEATGSPSKLTALLSRGSRSITDRALERVSRTA
jgi:acetolactate synthase I/III small subunit